MAKVWIWSVPSTMFLFLQFCLLAFSGLSMMQWFPEWNKWKACDKKNGKECCVNCVNLCKDCKYCKRCDDHDCNVHWDCRYCNLCKDCEKDRFCGKVCKMDDLPSKQPRYGFRCHDDDLIDEHWRFHESLGWIILFVDSVSKSLINICQNSASLKLNKY